jgi:hypothetical protein
MLATQGDGMPGQPESALNFDDALLELGVDAKATAEEVRRAYLRLVKTRSPERDPMGFRRARAAYEVVRTTLAMRQLAANSKALESPSAPEPIAKEPAGATGEALSSGESPSPAAAIDPASPASQDAPVQSRAAPAPGTIPNLSPEQQATIALVKRAWELRETSDWKLMVEAIEAATRWLSGPPVPVPACLYFIVALIGEEQIAAALEIRRALGKWFEARQDAARLLSGDLAARWLLAQELCAVAPEITVPAAAAIAKALLAGDLTQARSALAVATVVLNGPSIGVLFQRHAPHLIAALPERSVPQAGPRRTARSGSRVPIWTLAPLILFGLRALSGMESCVNSQPTNYSSPMDREPFVPPNVSAPPVPTNDRLQLSRPRLLDSNSDSSGESALSQGADAVARYADRLGLTDLAAAARALDEKRRAEGCPSVQPAIRAMKKAVDHAHDRGLRAAYRDLCAAADRECSSHEIVVDPVP